jgi:hypothetical protein
MLRRRVTATESTSRLTARARASTLRRRIALASAALLLLSWNAVAVLGAKGGGKALSGLNNPSGGSIDAAAPVVTRQS